MPMALPYFSIHRFTYLSVNMQKEIWKPVVGFEGLYEVSNLGRVKGVSRKSKRGNHWISVKETILKTGTSMGYPFVNLRRSGRVKSVKVHRLVAEAFIPNPENKKEIDHKNTTKTDNRVSNLHWVTRSENCRNPISLSRMIASVTQEGVHEKRKIACYTRNGDLVAIYPSIDEAAKAVGGSIYKIRYCLLKKNWQLATGNYTPQTHKGYIWKYND